MVLDRAIGLPVLMASAEGGMDIEEVAAKHAGEDPQGAGRRRRPACSRSRPAGSPSTSASPASRSAKAEAIMMALAKVFLEKDASLAEINPLAVTKKGDVVVARRQDRLRRQRPVPPQGRRRRCATWARRTRPRCGPAKANLNYIQLDGNIGCLVNGAGLAMATMDIIKYHGGEPANFLDVGGGVTAEGAIEAFRIILSDPKVKGDPGQHLRRHRQVRPDRRGAGEGRPRGRLQGAGGGAAGRDERRQGPRDPERREGRAADDPVGRRADRGGEDGGGSGESVTDQVRNIMRLSTDRRWARAVLLSAVTFTALASCDSKPKDTGPVSDRRRIGDVGHRPRGKPPMSS